MHILVGIWLLFTPGAAAQTAFSVDGSVIYSTRGLVGINQTAISAGFEVKSTTGAQGYVLLISSQNNSAMMSVSGAGNTILVGALTGSSATLTASGNNVFTLTTSSGIHFLAGGIKWADGSYSASSAAVGGGSSGGSQNSTFTYLNSEFTVPSATSMSECLAGSTVTFTTGANPVHVILNGAQAQTGSGQGTRFSVLLDGGWIDSFGPTKSMAPVSREGGVGSIQFFPFQLNYRTKTALSSGSHSFCVTMARTGGGTSYLACQSAGGFYEGSPCLFEVSEIK